MRYLLDTHILIWFSAKSKELSDSARKAIEDSENSSYFISIASLWEIAIKHNLGKIKLEIPLSGYKKLIEENYFEFLPISFEHILAVSSLPLHHRDPFDRILISQAMEENLTIISRDKNFRLYKDINLLW